MSRMGKYKKYEESVLISILNLTPGYEKSKYYPQNRIFRFQVSLPSYRNLSNLLKIPRTSFNDVIINLKSEQLITSIPPSNKALQKIYSHIFKIEDDIHFHPRLGTLFLTDKGENRTRCILKLKK